MTEDRTFADFDVHPDIVAALAEGGIVHPFPIQAMTLPVALSGHDIIGQAKTGTGKTLGFGIPLLQQTAVPGEPAYDALEAPGKPQALVVVPTRELAVQVAKDLQAAGRTRGIRVLTVYGGRAYEPQVEALRKGIDIVVGTPGRLLDLAQQGHLDLGHVRGVVLDEADEMLDLGFLPDVERMLALTPASRQTMLFSATMPGAVVALARRYMTQPTHIRAIDPTDDGATVAAVEQFVYRAHAMDKVELLARVLQAEGRGLTMIFSRTKRTAAKVADELAERGFASAAIHGDLGQGAREQAHAGLPQRQGRRARRHRRRRPRHRRRGHHARHQLPVPRGREDLPAPHRPHGRAGAAGVAITLVDWDDLPRWGLINTHARPRHPRAPGDVLQLRAPVRRPRHRPGHRRGAARVPAHPRRSGRRGGRGPRRDRPARWSGCRRRHGWPRGTRWRRQAQRWPGRPARERPRRTGPGPRLP